MSSGFSWCRFLAGSSAVAVISILGIGTGYAGGGPVKIKPPKVFPYVITQPGSYQLIGNISVTAGGTAIDIQASNVTLDLNGFTIQGAGGAYNGQHGIMANDANGRNITVKNGSVRAFSGIGIYLLGRGHIVMEVKADNNAGDGIYVSQSSLVQRCTATGNGGNGIETGKACTIKENVCSGSTGSGIRTGGWGSLVTQNICSSNTAHGVFADQGTAITQNTCSENTTCGIEMGGRCSAIQNTCFYNLIGIEDSASGCLIKDNSCTLNSFGGIAVVSNCQISQNSCARLNGIGIFCGGSYNSVTDNTCSGNTGAAIDLGNGGSNYAAQNKLSSNGSTIANSVGDTLGAGDLANVSF